MGTIGTGRITLLIAIVSLAAAIASAQPAPATRPSKNWRIMSLPEVKASAEANIVEAQIELASRYDTGHGITKDSLEAANWLRKAADAGSNDAAMTLAARLIEGTATQQKEAALLYQRAAQQGNPQAICQAGLCFQLGKGVEKDPAKAFDYFKQSATAGDLDAQYHLALCYREGAGTPTNPTEAASWLKRSADQGHADAACGLADMYRTGEGVEKNPREAVNLYLKAAQRNSLDAQWQLAQIYRDGAVVPKDTDKAITWLKKLAAAKHAEAQTALAQLSPAAIRQSAKPLTFVGGAIDEKLIGSLIRVEGEVKHASESNWTVLAKAPRSAAVEVLVTPPVQYTAAIAATRPSNPNRPAPRERPPSDARGRSSRVTGITLASEKTPNPNARPVREGITLTVWGILTADQHVKALLHQLTPPAVEWNYELREPGAIVAGRSQTYTVDGIIKNKGKAALKNVVFNLRVFQQSSPNDVEQNYTVKDLPAGATQQFTVDVSFHNYAYSGATSKPQVEMEVTSYEW